MKTEETPSAHKHWTKEELSRLFRLKYIDGISNSDLTPMFGRSTGSIAMALRNPKNNKCFDELNFDDIIPQTKLQSYLKPILADINRKKQFKNQ